MPDISHLRVFGCSCYPLLRPYNSNKLQSRTTKCVFLRYASKYKGYICFEVSKNKVVISRHVKFDETKFPYLILVYPNFKYHYHKHSPYRFSHTNNA